MKKFNAPKNVDTLEIEIKTKNLKLLIVMVHFEGTQLLGRLGVKELTLIHAC
jgi:hypothetical protein